MSQPAAVEAPDAPDAPEMPGSRDESTEIVKHAEGYAVDVMPLMTDEEIRRTWRTASALAASGMFKDAKQASQAFSKILLGRDLGLSPTQSMTGIHIVEGKPELAGVTLASFIRRLPHLKYKVVEQTNDACEIHFFERDGEGGEWEKLGVSRFTTEDAAKAGLLAKRGSADSNHVKYPRNMFWARAMSNGVKWFVPEVFGGIPVYVEGEITEALESGRHAAAEARQLPEPLGELVARAHAIDPTAWRLNEVTARLPLPHEAGYNEAGNQIIAEVTAWLEEHEPEDAVVVTPDAPAPEAEGPPEGQQIVEELQHKWDTDEAWRENAAVVLRKHVDLEEALDLQVAEGNERHAEELREELGNAEAALDALGIPVGWMPDGS